MPKAKAAKPAAKAMAKAAKKAAKTRMMTRSMAKAAAKPSAAETKVAAKLPLPMDCLVNTAAFSGNPPAIYALCLTTAAFHMEDPDGGVLATRLLREALSASLQRVLQFHAVPASAVAFGPLRRAGRPGAVLGGSTMVQVVLGETWAGSDIDILCTPAAAPAVRTQLVESGFSLARMHKSYDDEGNGMLSWLSVSDGRSQS